MSTMTDMSLITSGEDPESIVGLFTKCFENFEPVHRQWILLRLVLQLKDKRIEKMRRIFPPQEVQIDELSQVAKNK